MKPNPKLPPPARVGADDVKALPKPYIQAAMLDPRFELIESPEQVLKMRSAHDTVPAYGNAAIIPLRPGVPLPTKAQLRAIQKLMEMDEDELCGIAEGGAWRVIREDQSNPNSFKISEGVLRALGLLPTPTGRRKKGKK